MKIDTATRADYPALIALWEASVRASHHFLPEAEILALKPLILEHYFDAVTLHCARTEEGRIAGFLRAMRWQDRDAVCGTGGARQWRGAFAGGTCHQPVRRDAG